MKCSLLHLIFVIIFGSVVYGFSIPEVTLKVLQPKGIQFSLQEDANVIISDAQIFIILSKSNNINNLKFIDAQLTKDENGFWIYDDSNTEWSVNDSIEYWLNVEVSNLGYYTNKIVKVQDIMPLSEVKTVTSKTPISPTSTTPAPCEKSVTTVNGKPVGCKNAIIFYEDFKTDNLKYWSYDTRFPLDDSSADAEFNVYEKRPETSFVRDDILTLKSELITKFPAFDDARIRIGNYNLQQQCTPISTSDNRRECDRQGGFGYILPPVTSAFITTRDKFSFMYGRVEISCRVALGDYLYSQTTLQPVTRTNTSEHLKVFFVRGNEVLVDGADDVGGSRVYGGAILSRNPKNVQRWLKSKSLPNDHLGNGFHKYELVWTPKEISFFIDGINYGSLNSSLRESAMAEKIKSSVNWSNNGPFDKEHFLSIMVAAGSVKNFYSLNSTLLNGLAREPKPWNDTDPRAERSFYLDNSKWYPTWKKPSLEVDYIKIYAI